MKRGIGALFFFDERRNTMIEYIAEYRIKTVDNEGDTVGEISGMKDIEIMDKDEAIGAMKIINQLIVQKFLNKVKGTENTLVIEWRMKENDH